MAVKNNATCSICGNEYYMCHSCRDSIKANPWKMHTDTAEHYKVYQIIHGISTGVYDKDEARAKFKNVDLRDLESFRPHIKKIVKDILKEPVVKPVKEEKTVEILTVEKADDADITMVENIEKAIVSRKRNYKVNNEVEETE